MNVIAIAEGFVYKVDEIMGVIHDGCEGEGGCNGVMGFG